MRIRLTALALATAMALPTAANAYSNIYFFGDSLSDIGAFGGLGGLPVGAHWTYQNQPNWTSVLSGHYGLSSVANNPSNAKNTSSTGNNYAQGGAVAQTYQSITQFPGTTGANGSVEQYGPDGSTAILELPVQVQNYLASTGGKADPNAVYSVWIGGNDISAAAGTLSSDSTTATATKLLATSAGTTGQLIGALQSAGAKTIIVPNVPSLASTPAALYQTVQQVATKVGQGVGLSGTNLTNYVNQAVGAAWQAVSSSSATQANQSAVIAQALAAANTAMGAPDSVTTLTSSYNTVLSALQQLTSGYNSLMDNALVSNGLQHGIVRANIAQLMTEISANPSKYGFTNTLGSICASDAITCSQSAYAQSYVFTDGLHPTPAAHQIIGDYVYGLLQSPYFAAAMPDSALNNARQLGSALDARYQAIRSQARAVGTVSAFVDGAFNQDKIGFNNLTAEPKGQLYTIGVDFQATPSLTLGLSMSHQMGKADVTTSGTPGTLNDRSTLMAGLISYNQDKFWVDGDVHIGSGDVDTNRVTTLGPTTVSNSATTHQDQFGMRINGGYRLQYGSFTTGPVAGLDFAHAKVAGFSEQGNNSSSMTFGNQSLSSLVGRVGWQLDATIGKFSPYGKVSYAHEFKQDDRSVTSGLVTTIGDWTTSIGKPDNNWMEWTAGVSANFNKKVTAFGQLTATSGKNGGNQTGGNIGVAVSF
ncbi:autotransporter outer membrane beta-barrel domain-containing protein [Chromobacterium sp. ASV23]|uniref:autotransporter outer membrane beta-barrel domain-containing protein n=1 Tax=Chromobacterium sp. ASV23 TaxID=2795110 RepID=UPI0018ED0055|nr:autotransporter domain-containing protein [Chromobacterium sp. ASV23]